MTLSIISRGSKASSRRLFSSMSSVMSNANTNSSNDASQWLLPAALGGALVGAYTLSQGVHAEEVIHPQHQPWSHNGYLGSLDTASLRRGFEVYRNVCSTCHSLKFINFRNLVDVTHTEAQVKALAKSYKIRDGPDGKGEYFDRPRILSDPLPQPYESDEAARDANGGALPPDLSLITKARHGGEDYIFAILTGYRDPPAGVSMRSGLHYNPYFPGSAISMRQVLQDGGIEYEDGTPATISQQAKDVVTFLVWTAEPKYDERKKLGFRLITASILMAICAGYSKRFVWNILKSRRVTYLE